MVLSWPPCSNERRWRLATGGYLGHMFELYSAWTWLPVFVAASTAAAGMAEGPATRLALVRGRRSRRSPSAELVASGADASPIGADASGLSRRAMAASGTCALLIGFTFGRSLWLLVPVALAWGFFVIADSAQFSVLVTEAVPPHAVGTALTVQTSIGFLLTMVSIQLVPPVQHVVGWRWAFVMLALGPVVGIAAIRRLDSAPNRRAQGLMTLAGGRGLRSISLSRWSSRRSVRSCSSRSRSSASRRVEFRRI